MPLRDYVQSVRGAFQPNSGSSSSTSEAADASNAAEPRWALRGDLPSEHMFIPDECLFTLTSTTFRPLDKMSGVIIARHGALGASGGYSFVQISLYAYVRLVKTSKKGETVAFLSNQFVPISYDIDTVEKRLIKVAGETLYQHTKEGMREGKEIPLPFQLLIPSEAEGYRLAPTLSPVM